MEPVNKDRPTDGAIGKIEIFLSLDSTDISVANGLMKEEPGQIGNIVSSCIS